MDARETPREKQINFIVSDEEADAFDRVAAHFDVAVPAMIRMLVHAKDAELSLIAGAKLVSDSDQDDFKWKDWHTYILQEFVGTKDPMTRESLATELVPNPQFNGADLGLLLNQLTRNGYLRRLKTGYAITPKGDVILK